MKAVPGTGEAERMKATDAPIPMSYGPKLDAVFEGRCTQTIRRGRKYAIGERRWIFEWSGKPRRSKWGRRILVEIMLTVDGTLFEHVTGWESSMGLVYFRWQGEYLNALAKADFIEPPTGEALRDVLKRLNGPHWEGEYQVIRWRILNQKPGAKKEGQ